MADFLSTLLIIYVLIDGYRWTKQQKEKPPNP